MKRNDRRNVKTSPDQEHANPLHYSQNQNERHVTGDVHVGGKLEIDLSPNLVNKHDAERTEDGTKGDKQFFWSTLIQSATLGAVVIYAGLTGWQGCMTRTLVKTAQNTYAASERPYVGTDAITVLYQCNSAKAAVVSMLPRPVGKCDAIELTARVKNFGPVPGTDFRMRWELYIDGVLEKDQPKIPDRPTTIFPSQVIETQGTVFSPIYDDLMAARKTLEVRLFVNYSGADGAYPPICEIQRFHPVVYEFVDLGPCPQ